MNFYLGNYRQYKAIFLFLDYLITGGGMTKKQELSLFEEWVLLGKKYFSF